MVCAIVRLPFIHAAYNSSNFTMALYKLGMPTQLQLHISIVALALGKLLRFLNFLDVGYLSSAIEPTHGKGTIHKTGKSKYGYNSKKGNDTANSRHVKSKSSIDDHDSSKDLVPKSYGRTVTEVGRVSPIPMQGMRSESDAKPHDMRHGASQDEIRVTTQYEVRHEDLEAKERW